MQSRKMKSIFAAVVLVSLIVAIHCSATEAPTQAQLECINDASINRANEVLRDCGNLAMDSVRSETQYI